MTKYMNISILIILLVGCKEKLADLDTSKVKKETYTTVEVADVEVSNTPIPIYSIGKVASAQEVKLSFKIGGIISEIRGEEGQSIRKGAVLAQLRTNEIDAQVSKAKRAFEKAQRDLDRTQKMYNEGAATLENIQDLITLVEVSQEDVRVAQFNRQYANITSPVFGRILKKNAEANELVGAGQPIFVIAARQNSSLLKASISDKDITKVNYGDKAKVYFDAFPDETFIGSILRISESADPRTGTFEVEIDVNEKGKRLRNGYIGRVEFYPNQVTSYYKIPMDALVEGVDDGVIIFTPAEDGASAVRHIVQPEYIGKDYFTVRRENVTPFTKVITTGAPFLLDGGEIHIKS